MRCLLPWLQMVLVVTGQLFDTDELRPEIEKQEDDGKVFHKLMTRDELRYYFGTDSPDQVSKDQYKIVLIKNVMHEEHEKAKRSGKAAPDASYKLNVFGNNYNLRLKRNAKLVAPNATLLIQDGPSTNVSKMSLAISGNVHGEDDDEYDTWGITACEHYLLSKSHYDESEFSIEASLAECEDEENGEMEMSGFIYTPEETFEVLPLSNRTKRLARMDPLFSDEYIKNFNITSSRQPRMATPHLVKRVSLPSHKALFGGETNRPVAPINQHLGALGKRSGASTRSASRTIETAVFLDAKAYRMYSNYFASTGSSNPTGKVRDLLLTFVNDIQALYHFPSLGSQVDFSIVHMEIMKTQPPKLPTYNGDRSRLLQSFCSYQGDKNPSGDSNPGHWDIGLYISGEDFYVDEGEKRSFLTMGLATVTGICTNSYGCVIGEFGVRDPHGKPYPSTGFTAVYVMAHEIGHNLGMSHDSSGNSCASNGFIMSPSRGTKGETVWSQCSREHMARLDLPCLEDSPAAMSSENNHNKYNNYPGQHLDGDTQCQTLIMDPDAHVDHNEYTMHQICESMKCRSANRAGFYRAGPALEGTPCGLDKICEHGKCQKNTISAGATSVSSWSSWTTGSCQSGCITRSKGFKKMTRTCNKQIPVTIKSGCPGSSTDVQFCSDATCGMMEIVSDYADRHCKLFRKSDKSKRLRKMIVAHGKQPNHNKNRVMQACTVHCKRVKNGGWYAPVLELNDVKEVDVYFPDGTWCHNDGSADYYCKKHQCLSSNRGSRAEKTPDLLVSSNARPDDEAGVPEELENYYTLNDEDKPLADNVEPSDNNEVSDDKWKIDDKFDDKAQF